MDISRKSEQIGRKHHGDAFFTDCFCSFFIIQPCGARNNENIKISFSGFEDEGFVKRATEKYGSKIAVGVDIRDGYVAIKGWTQLSEFTCFDFCEKIQKLGVETLICTDISKDGAMQGTNIELYRELSERFNIQIIASGGVSSIDDVKRLAAMNIYGAIVGKAYYTKAISLKEAIEVAL